MIYRHLPPDSGIDHAYQAGGYLSQGQATEKGGSHKPGEVSHHPPTQGDDAIATFGTAVHQPVIDADRRLKGLASLPLRYYHRVHSEASFLQNLLHSVTVERKHAVIAHNMGPALKSSVSHPPPQLVKEAPADKHRIAFGSSGHDAGSTLLLTIGRIGFPGIGHRGKENPLPFFAPPIPPAAYHLFCRLLEGQIVGVHRPIRQSIIWLAKPFEPLYAPQRVRPSEQRPDLLLIAGLSILKQPLIYGGWLCLKADNHTASHHQFPVGGIHNGTAAGGDNRLLLLAYPLQHFPLQLAKPALPILGEYLGNRLAPEVDDLLVNIDKTPAQPPGYLLTHLRLAGIGEASQDDVSSSSFTHFTPSR